MQIELQEVRILDHRPFVLGSSSSGDIQKGILGLELKHLYLRYSTHR
jgi:hypothetical protein